MADLESTAVEQLDGWQVRQPNRTLIVRRFALTLTGQGTTANKIPASVLGFAEIVEASVGVTNDNLHLVVAAPSSDGSHLLLKASATDAPADLTGTLVINVSGR